MSVENWFWTQIFSEFEINTEIHNSKIECREIGRRFSKKSLTNKVFLILFKAVLIKVFLVLFVLFIPLPHEYQSVFPKYFVYKMNASNCRQNTVTLFKHLKTIAKLQLMWNTYWKMDTLWAGPAVVLVAQFAYRQPPHKRSVLFRKQILKFSFEPKSQQKYFLHFFPCFKKTVKKWSKLKTYYMLFIMYLSHVSWFDHF